MKKLLVFLLMGILSAQENPEHSSTVPQLKVGEFTIIGIDTFRAQRPIVDVTPGFRSYISIEEPDLVGFISGQFPIKTFDIKVKRHEERSSFIRSSFGFGYGGYLHLRLLGGKFNRSSSKLGNLTVSGRFGSDHGLTTIRGFISFSKKSSILWTLTAGLFSKTEKALKGDTLMVHKLFSPSIRGTFQYLPADRGIFTQLHIDENFIISDTGRSLNFSWSQLNASVGYVVDWPFKVSANLKFQKLKSASVKSIDFSVGYRIGRIKSSMSAGYGVTSNGVTSPIFHGVMVFPFASNFKFGVKVEKTFQTADFGFYEINSALLGDVSNPFLKEDYIGISTHYTTGVFALQFGTGYKKYSSVPILVKNPSKFWILTSDTGTINGPVIEFSLYDYRHLAINGSYFLASQDSLIDTLLLKGQLDVSYVMPESKFIPGIKFNVSLVSYNRRSVAQQSFNIFKSFTRHTGAFIKITNPFKEGFEVFAPGYKINNGLSLALGLTMKF